MLIRKGLRLGLGDYSSYLIEVEGGTKEEVDKQILLDLIDNKDFLLRKIGSMRYKEYIEAFGGRINGLD